jgi:probable rRNA maturation factor
MIALDIAVDHHAWQEPEARAILEEAASATMTKCGFRNVDTEVSILLTGDMHMAEINGRWRAKPKTTNVLSFPAHAMTPGQMPGPLLGDIVLAHETIAREAITAARAFEDHLFHLAVHATLHLLGHDHENDDEAAAMESLEIAILDDKGLPDPYLKVDP